MTRISQLRMHTIYAFISIESAETVGKMLFSIVVGTRGGFSPHDIVHNVGIKKWK